MKNKRNISLNIFQYLKKALLTYLWCKKKSLKNYCIINWYIFNWKKKIYTCCLSTKRKKRNKKPTNILTPIKNNE